MEIRNESFKIIENENNYCKFEWKNILPTTNPYVHSSTFTIENCNVNWQIIIEFLLNSNMRIGLRKIDFRNKIIKTSLSCKVRNSTREYAPINVESTFSHEAKTCFSDYIEIRYLYSKSTCYTKMMNIEGRVVIQQCSESSSMGSATSDGMVQKLQIDFESVFRSGAFTDVTFTIGNETIKVHKVVLCARSPVFKRLFENDLKENQSHIIEVTGVDNLSFDKFLNYLYTGKFGKCNLREVMDLYSLADKYEVITLQNTCRDTIKTYINENNVSLILLIANMRHDVVLKDFCVKFICDNFHEVEPTAAWGKLVIDYPQLASYTLKQISKKLQTCHTSIL